MVGAPRWPRLLRPGLPGHHGSAAGGPAWRRESAARLCACTAPAPLPHGERCVAAGARARTGLVLRPRTPAAPLDDMAAGAALRPPAAARQLLSRSVVLRGVGGPASGALHANVRPSKTGIVLQQARMDLRRAWHLWRRARRLPLRALAVSARALTAAGLQHHLQRAVVQAAAAGSRAPLLLRPVTRWGGPGWGGARGCRGSVSAGTACRGGGA